jgi:hypothetical protein
MRKFLIISLALAALPIAAHAKEVKIAGTHSETEIQSACKQADGHFESGGSSYSCTKYNCDGKGGNCSVNCQKGKCTGTTPLQHVGQLTLTQALTLSPGTRGGPPPAGPLESGPGGTPQGPSSPGATRPAPQPGKLY